MADPEAVSVDRHPSARRPVTEFSEIKIDAKDWSNLLRVSVVAKSMLACINPCIARLMNRYLRGQSISGVCLYYG